MNNLNHFFRFQNFKKNERSIKYKSKLPNNNDKNDNSNLLTNSKDI